MFEIDLTLFPVLVKIFLQSSNIPVALVTVPRNIAHVVTVLGIGTWIAGRHMSALLIHQSILYKMQMHE